MYLTNATSGTSNDYSNVSVDGLGPCIAILLSRRREAGLRGMRTSLNHYDGCVEGTC